MGYMEVGSMIFGVNFGGAPIPDGWRRAMRTGFTLTEL